MTVLNSYPAYKPSGAEWLGDVPANWEVSTLRRRLRTYGGIKIGPFGSQLKLEQMSPSGYKVYGQANVIARDFARGTKFVDQEKFNELSACVVLPGDLLVTMMGTSGRCAYVPDDAVMGIMDSHLLRLRTNGSLNIKFASLIIDESSYVKDQIETAGKGSIMHGLNSSIVKDLVLALPPLSEQTAIVRFLDHADRRIRRYIRARQKLIALLEEQKQAIIHQAVTGQIDVRTGQPYPAYKPSGVEWLGNVPAHWETAKIKRLARPGYKTFVDGDWIESPYITPDGIRLIQTGNIGVGEYREKGFRYISKDTFKSFGCTEVMPGDILICRLGEPVARTCIAPNLDRRMITSVDVCILKLPEEANAQFLVYSMSSRRYLDWVGSLVRGSTRDRVSRSMLGSFSVPFPLLSEQTGIVAFLDKASVIIDTAISRTCRQIKVLQKYRTRLIADVVTGKLDVREAAATLPKVDPMADEDDLDDSFHADADPELDEIETNLEEAEA